MSCVTCTHTMDLIGEADRCRYYHCPRCGTMFVKSDGSQADRWWAPKLVERCREFEATLGPAWGALWHRLGIKESIHRPEDRS